MGSPLGERFSESNESSATSVDDARGRAVRRTRG